MCSSNLASTLIPLYKFSVALKNREIKRNGPTWILSFEPAKNVALESCVPEADLTFQHISKVSALPFKEKVQQTKTVLCVVSWHVKWIRS